MDGVKAQYSEDKVNSFEQTCGPDSQSRSSPCGPRDSRTGVAHPPALNFVSESVESLSSIVHQTSSTFDPGLLQDSIVVGNGIRDRPVFRASPIVCMPRSFRSISPNRVDSSETEDHQRSRVVKFDSNPRASGSLEQEDVDIDSSSATVKKSNHINSSSRRMWTAYFLSDLAHVVVFAMLGIICRQFLTYLLGREVLNITPTPLFPEIGANMLGSFLMGVVVKAHTFLAASTSYHQSVHLAVSTGFIGSFTSFSTWIFRCAFLLYEQMYADGFASIALGFILSVSAFQFGRHCFIFLESFLTFMYNHRDKPLDNGDEESSSEKPVAKDYSETPASQYGTPTTGTVKSSPNTLTLKSLHVSGDYDERRDYTIRFSEEKPVDRNSPNEQIITESETDSKVPPTALRSTLSRTRTAPLGAVLNFPPINRLHSQSGKRVISDDEVRKVRSEVCLKKLAEQSAAKHDCRHAEGTEAIRRMLDLLFITEDSKKALEEAEAEAESISSFSEKQVHAPEQKQTKRRILLLVNTALYIVLATTMFCIIFTSPSDSDMVRQYAIPAMIGPIGAILRWQISKLNKPCGVKFLDKLVGKFPIGTFISNTLGVFITTVAYRKHKDLQALEEKGVEISDTTVNLIVSVTAGIAGCTSTVSTFVAELHLIPLKYSYSYFLVTTFGNVLLSFVTVILV